MVHELVGQPPAALLDLLDFEVRDSCLQFRIPIDEALILVNEALLTQLHESLDHGP